MAMRAAALLLTASGDRGVSCAATDTAVFAGCDGVTSAAEVSAITAVVAVD